MLYFPVVGADVSKGGGGGEYNVSAQSSFILDAILHYEL